MGAKTKTQKKLQNLQQNLKKSLDLKLNPKKSHAKFLSLEIFQKGLNDIAREKKEEIECFVVVLHFKPKE